MFGSKFGLNRFSLGKLDMDVGIRAYLLEHMNNVSSFGENIPFDTSLSERMGASTILTLADPFDASLSENVYAQSKLDILLLITGSLKEKIENQLDLVKDIFSRTTLSEQIAHDVYLSKDITVWDNAEENIESDSYLSKNMILSPVLTEMMGAMVSAVILDREVILLHGVTLAPGSTLYVNTDLFVALVNNQNAIHLHKGDWPTLSRGLVSVDIDTGVVGKLEGKLIFNERYL